MHICKHFLSISIAAALLFGQGCGKKIKTEGKSTPRSTADTNVLPRRLISDYKGMKENDTVSWYWLKTGFKIDLFRSAKIHPLRNYSHLNNTRAEGKLKEALKGIFGTPETSQHGSTDVEVVAAIVEMKAKPGFFKSFFPTIDDYPFIEVEIVIFDETTKTALFKLCHYKKAEDFDEALNGIIKDLRTFFGEKS